MRRRGRTTGLVYRAGEGRPCNGARVGCRPNDRRTRYAWSAQLVEAALARRRVRRGPGGVRDPRPGRRPDVRAARSRLPSSSGSRSATSRSRTRSAGGSSRRSCVRSGSSRSCWTPVDPVGSGVDRPERPRGPGVGGRLPDPARGRGAVGTPRRAARRGRVPRRAGAPGERRRAQLAAWRRSQVGFRAGMAFVIGGVAGSFVSSLRRHRRRGRATGRRSCGRGGARGAAASQAAQAQREVAAFHAAVLADAQPERLAEILRATAEAVATRAGMRGARAAHACDRRRGRGSGSIAAGVYGDPGYLLGDALFPASSPVAAAAAEGEPSSPTGTSSCRCGCAAPWSGRCTSVGDRDGRPREGRGCSRRSRTSSGWPSRPRGSAPSRRRSVDRLTELDAMKRTSSPSRATSSGPPSPAIRGFVDMLLRRAAATSAPSSAKSTSSIVSTQTDRLIQIWSTTCSSSPGSRPARSCSNRSRWTCAACSRRSSTALGDAGARIQLEGGTDAPDADGGSTPTD